MSEQQTADFIRELMHDAPDGARHINIGDAQRGQTIWVLTGVTYTARQVLQATVTKALKRGIVTIRYIEGHLKGATRKIDAHIPVRIGG